MACPVAGEMASGCRKTLFWHFSITKFARKLLNVRSPQARISVASFGGKGHSSPTLIFPPKVKCHSPADLPMPSCTSFPPHTPLQLLSSRRSGAEPCTAQRSGGGATSSFDLLKRALFHNALTAIYEMTSRLSTVLLGVAGVDLPAALVVLLSLIIGLLMVVVFRYTSDQKAIRLAKDQLKAHLLAVRLFQDQLPVVLSSYGRILRCTGHYLRLAFKPLLFVVLPLTFLIVQLDRYLGWAPVPSGQAFLVKVRTTGPEALNEASLLLPSEMKMTAPAVHVPARNEVVWRVVAEKNGDYNVTIGVASQTVSKRVVISSGLSRISPIRLQGRFWERIFVSGEPALPESSPIQSVEVGYPSRNIRFMGLEWNWIWLFFVLSLVAGFVFKSVLKIEI